MNTDNVGTGKTACSLFICRHTSAYFDYTHYKPLNTSYADTTNQTSEVYETSEVFTQTNSKFIRRGEWHAPAVQYHSTPVQLLPFERVGWIKRSAFTNYR
jgi:hypothetical protein